MGWWNAGWTLWRKCLSWLKCHFKLFLILPFLAFNKYISPSNDVGVPHRNTDQMTVCFEHLFFGKSHGDALESVILVLQDFQNLMRYHTRCFYSNTLALCTGVVSPLNYWSKIESAYKKQNTVCYSENRHPKLLLPAS